MISGVKSKKTTEGNTSYSLEKTTCRKGQVDGVDAHGDCKVGQDWNKNIRCRRVGGDVRDGH